MYIYNYLHIWRAARYVKNAPASNYADELDMRGWLFGGGGSPVLLFSKLTILLLLIL